MNINNNAMIAPPSSGPCSDSLDPQLPIHVSQFKSPWIDGELNILISFRYLHPQYNSNRASNEPS